MVEEASRSGRHDEKEVIIRLCDILSGAYGQDASRALREFIFTFAPKNQPIPRNRRVRRVKARSDRPDLLLIDYEKGKKLKH